MSVFAIRAWLRIWSAIIVARLMRLVGLVALGLVAMTSCSGGASNASPTPEAHDISGVYTIAGTSCTDLPVSAFRELPGLTITVTDSQGTNLGTGKLSAQGVSTTNPVACALRFSIPNVSKAANYTIDTGTLASVSYSYDELKGDNWQANLSVGK